METDQMEKSRRPEIHGEAITVQERLGSDSKLVIINLRRAILGRAVGAGGFDGVVEVAEEKITETGAQSKFTTLIGVDVAATGVAMLCQKCLDDVKRRLFGGGEKDPAKTQGHADHEEVRRVTIVRTNDTIFHLIRPRVIRGRCPHKTEVHIEPTLLFCCPYSGSLRRLFPDSSLLFEINESERVIIKYGRKSSGELREHVELINPGRAQAKEPYFGLKLSCLRGRFVTEGLLKDQLLAFVDQTKDSSCGWGLGWVDPDWRLVDSKYVSGAIVEPVATGKGE
jgi:hypothetical protein